MYSRPFPLLSWEKGDRGMRPINRKGDFWGLAQKK